MAKDVFISYKSEEFKQADMVRSVLERNGITCWMAPADIPSGSNYAVEVPNAIRSARVVVFILSEQSQKSEWTQKELDIALNAKKPIMPFALEDCDLISPFDFYLGNVQRNDVFQDVSEGLEKLVHDIKALTGADDAAVDIPADTLQALRQSVVMKSGGNKLVPIIAACAVVVVAVIAAFALLSGGGNSSSVSASATAASTKQLAAEVYASQVGTYMEAGTVNSYQNMTKEGENSIDVSEAFSILSFVRNQGDAAAQVESVTMEISSLEPIEDPIMKADATVTNGDTLLVYAANDGWGTSKDTEIE
ncbi:MAG: toll/interleukin-1 receptor domain-containing protein, partial [Eggerthellaceae bacterium]|nr:toll/interleukin-1 receptor domain-containing protein [Eggerthellaceae bacterium]